MDIDHRLKDYSPQYQDHIQRKATEAANRLLDQTFDPEQAVEILTRAFADFAAEIISEINSDNRSNSAQWVMKQGQ